MNVTRNFLILACVVVAMRTTSNVRADFVFGQPVNLGPTVNSSSEDWGPHLSADGLSLFFSSDRPGGFGDFDIWVATRPAKDGDWRTPVPLPTGVNSSAFDSCPSISADGLTLYFGSSRPGGSGDVDIWVTTRATQNDTWAAPVNLGPTVNSPAFECDPSISADGLTLYFSSLRSGGFGNFDIWVTTRATKNDPWGVPVNLGPTVNGSTWDDSPSISADGLSLFYLYGGGDIWMTTRATKDDAWGTPVTLGTPLNSGARDWAPDISSDGRHLVLVSGRGFGFGAEDIWEAPIIPIVDFSADGIVDLEDLVILIEHWGTNETLCDIGPMPWGDGKVDEKDLEVLMRYWQQEVLPVSLIAYWKLDEVEGTVAADKAGTNNGTLLGNPIWQPTSGKLGGALQFDGKDDCVTTRFVLNPFSGPFSVFAWVKGGAPGQAVVSQEKGGNWLLASAPDGGLATELGGSTRAGKALESTLSVTDGGWHRVGLVWDGANRVLYLDDVEVARGTLAGLPSSTNGLYLGADSNLTPGTFWSGLIDEVRIYNQAVKP